MTQEAALQPGSGDNPDEMPIDLGMVAGRNNHETKLAHRVATMLQSRIISEHMQPGQCLGTATEIRAHYKVGRWALREAVAILELRGIARLRSGPGGGLVVADPNFDDLVNVAALYLLAKQATAAELATLRRAVLSALMRKLLDTGQSHSPIRDGLLPWQHLAACAGNGALEMAVEFIESLVAAYAAAPPTEIPPPTLADLYDAIASRNSEAAFAALDKILARDEHSLAETWNERTEPKLHKAGTRKLAHRLAIDLIHLIADGEHSTGKIGSEINIGQRFDASAETVRQAIRIVEDIGVASPRRGRHGGVESHPPNASAIAALIPHLLAKQCVSVPDCFEAARYLSAEIAIVAAENVRRAGGHCAQDLPEPAPASSDPIEIDRQIQAIADNPLLVSIERGLGFYACAIDPPETSPPAAVQTVIARSHRVLAAVLAGDTHLAQTAMHDRFKAMGNRFRRDDTSDDQSGRKGREYEVPDDMMKGTPNSNGG